MTPEVKKKKRKFLKRVKNDIAYFAIKGLVLFFNLPPRRIALAISLALGKFVNLVFRKEYNKIIRHLNFAFEDEKDDTEISKIARGVFPNLAMNFVDMVRLGSMNTVDLVSICVVHGRENIDAIKEGGRGAVCLFSHSGCWELLGAYLAQTGIPLSAVARNLYDPRLDRMINDLRQKTGMKIIIRGEDTREMVRDIKNGGFIATLVDQDTKVKGIFVDFFGKPAHTPVSPAVLSLKYGLPILPIFTRRDDRHFHHVHIGKAIIPSPTGDTERDIRELTRRCAEVTENFIRQYPEQWVWFHRRWKKKEQVTYSN